MIAFECILARVTSRAGIPQFAFGGREQVLQDVFADASNGDIALGVNNAALDPPMSNKSGFFALDLHQALSAVTQNGPNPPAKRIAVLFADYYRPFPAALGVMFDRGFETPDDRSSARIYRQLPREGCAIFLDAIAQYRPTKAQAEREALFTTIHELGHVFNLQHANAPPNFLAQSLAKAYPPEAYQFLPEHRMMLAHCSTSRFVCPGGSPFQDSGTFANHNVARHRASPSPDFGLEMSISMPVREFWAFEPVELDIELRVAPGVYRRFRVPHALDPGYETFRIWIEEPTGERRRVRSPRRYCGVTKSLLVKPGKPFSRDLSIFGEAGGYTFRQSGVHRLWAEFETKPGLILRSNDLEVNVLPTGNSAAYDAASAALTRRDRAAILYHRLLRRSRHDNLALLAAFARSATDLPSSGSIIYAVARATYELAEGRSKRHREAARELFKEAADNPCLGRRQRELTERALAGKLSA